MKASDKTNPALLIDPEQYYSVNYTIDQSGKKHEYPQSIQGKDMTEKQIIDYVNRVDISEILITDSVCAKCGGTGVYTLGYSDPKQVVCECKKLSHG